MDSRFLSHHHLSSGFFVCLFVSPSSVLILLGEEFDFEVKRWQNERYGRVKRRLFCDLQCLDCLRVPSNGIYDTLVVTH